MTFNPPRVSSNVDKNNPVSTCTLLERFFKLFPIREIMNPEIGMKMNTKMVSFKLMVNMTKMVNRIVKGSLTNNSKMANSEF